MKRISQIAALLLSASAVYGQTVLATVTGTITDPAGAVVASASVSLKNVETGQSYTAASSDAGNYTVPQVPLGDYNLTVAVPGFKTYEHNKFHLSAGQTLREDIVLQVGQTSESVTVSADASLLQTESSQLVHNVTLSQLDNLPLLSVGATNDGLRDYFAASRLLPGIQYQNSGNFSAVVQAVVNGTPSNTLQSRLDGATMNPTSLRLLGATMETQPSPESLQEVAILTSNFAPEFGTAGGAVVNMVTKSGTNQFHGSGYDYLVNEAFNAAQPYTGIKNKLRQNDYGFTFGGPVRIPKVYNGTDKTFFFFNFEQFRQNLINNTLPSTVPIAAYRQGDFSSLITTENRLVTTASGPYTDPLGRTIPSGTIFDPADTVTVNGVVVRNPFPNNKIPTNRFDPVSAKILGMVPQPLGPNAGAAGANYLAPFDQGRVSNAPSLKVDQSIGAKTHMAFYFQRTNTSTPRTITAADDLPNNITGSAISANAARTARVNVDYTATPRLLLHTTFGWNDSDFLLQSQNYPFDAQSVLGIPGQTAARTFPIINTNGLSALGLAITQPANTAEGGMTTLGGSFDQHFFERRPSFNISGTYVVGAHSFKAGFEIRTQKFPNYNWSGSAGTYFTVINGAATTTPVSTCTTQSSLVGTSLSNGFAGFGLASFLLGCISSTSINSPIAAMTHNYQSAIYLQDSWKVTRKLTMDYGLRWDYGTYQREQYGRYASFSSSVANPSASGHLGGQIFEATCNCQFAHNYPYALGPRLGAAYQINEKTVLNAGFGVVYGANTVQTGSTTNLATSSTPAFGQTVGALQNGVPSNVSIQWPSFSASAGQAAGAVVAPPTLLDPNAGRPMRLLQWNVTLQREITRNIVVKAGYVGNRGVWEEAGTSLAPQNALSQATLRSFGFNDFTSSAQSALLTTPIASLTPAQKAQLSAMGVSLTPYANFPASQTVRQALLPFPQYTGLLAPAGAPLGKNWYDALQTTVTKRFSHGLVFNANYTYSKTMALTTTQDPFNRNLGKNLSAFDLPHQFRLTAQYEVPRINSNLPVLKNKVVAYALSGWGTGWSLSYQSAPLVGLPTSSGSVPISNFLGYGPGPAQLIPGMSPWSVDWTDLSGVHHTDPLDINCHCFDPTKTQVLNPAAWTNVPNGQFAANQSSIRAFRGIRIPVENANFGRNFRIKERYSLNIRIEFTNIFNRLQLPFGTTTGGVNLGNFTTTPTTFTSGPNKGLYSGGFGTIVTPLNGSVTGQRAGTLVARFIF
jgi:hypothetical protein